MQLEILLQNFILQSISKFKKFSYEFFESFFEQYGMIGMYGFAEWFSEILLKKHPFFGLRQYVNIF